MAKQSTCQTFVIGQIRPIHMPAKQSTCQTIVMPLQFFLRMFFQRTLWNFVLAIRPNVGAHAQKVQNSKRVSNS